MFISRYVTILDGVVRQTLLYLVGTNSDGLFGLAYSCMVGIMSDDDIETGKSSKYFVSNDFGLRDWTR